MTVSARRLLGQTRHELWTGESVTRVGTYYRVDRARLYTLPDSTIEVPISAFGPKATDSIATYADGFISTSPAGELLERYRSKGGRGPSMAGLKVCWGPDEAECVKRAHSLWRNSVVAGELAQELDVPAHFDQASELVTEDAVREKFACGPDPDRYVEAIEPYLDAGFDEMYVSQMGDDQEGFLRFFTREVQPRL